MLRRRETLRRLPRLTRRPLLHRRRPLPWRRSRAFWIWCRSPRPRRPSPCKAGRPRPLTRRPLRRPISRLRRRLTRRLHRLRNTIPARPPSATAPCLFPWAGPGSAAPATLRSHRIPGRRPHARHAGAAQITRLASDGSLRSSVRGPGGRSVLAGGGGSATNAKPAGGVASVAAAAPGAVPIPTKNILKFPASASWKATKRRSK